MNQAQAKTDESASTPSRRNKMVRRTWMTVSQAFIFMTTVAVSILFGLLALTGRNVVQGSGELPVDWQDPFAVRVFLWSFVAMIAVGVAYATYLVNNKLCAAILTAALAGLTLTTSNWEVTITCLFALAVGYGVGVLLIRYGRDSNERFWISHSARIVGLFLIATGLFVFSYQTEEHGSLWWVAPVFYLKMAIYYSGGVMDWQRRSVQSSLE